jgi:hypothetical protein
MIEEYNSLMDAILTLVKAQAQVNQEVGHSPAFDLLYSAEYHTRWAAKELLRESLRTWRDKV